MSGQGSFSFFNVHWDALSSTGFVKSMNSRHFGRDYAALARGLLLDDPTILATLAAMTDVSKETQR